MQKEADQGQGKGAGPGKEGRGKEGQDQGTRGVVVGRGQGRGAGQDQEIRGVVSRGEEAGHETIGGGAGLVKEAEQGQERGTAALCRAWSSGIYATDLGPTKGGGDDMGKNPEKVEVFGRLADL